MPKPGRFIKNIRRAIKITRNTLIGRRIIQIPIKMAKPLCFIILDHKIVILKVIKKIFTPDIFSFQVKTIPAIRQLIIQINIFILPIFTTGVTNRHIGIIVRDIIILIIDIIGIIVILVIVGIIVIGITVINIIAR